MLFVKCGVFSGKKSVLEYRLLNPLDRRRPNVPYHDALLCSSFTSKFIRHKKC